MRCWLFALPLLTLACDSPAPEAPKRAEAPAAKPTPIPPPAADAEPEPACTEGHVKALARTLADAKPAARPDIVARGLADACQMPSYLVRYFELAQRQGPGGPPLRAPSPSEYRPVLARACEDPSVLDETAKDSDPAAAMALVFERCKLGRTGVVDQATYLRRRPTSALPFVAHQWLLDQGVDAESARTVAAAVALFDRREQGPVQPTPQLAVPTVDFPLDPVPDAPLLYLSGDSLRTSEHKLLGLTAGRLGSADVNNHLIPALYDRLAALADAGKTAADSEPWKGVLGLVADEQTPYDTVVDVLYTSGRAEFSAYAFVLDSGAYEYGAVRLEPPKFSLTPDPAAPTGTPTPTPALLVTIDAEGFLVRNQGEATPEPERLGVRAGVAHEAWDYPALTARAREHRRAYADARTAVVSPDGDVPYGVVARTVAALRGPDCTRASDCVLPTLVVTSPGTTTYSTKPAGLSPELAALTQGMDPGVEKRGGTSGVGVGKPPSTPPEGPLDKDSIRRVIRSNIKQVRYCYEKALVKDPGEKGKVVVALTIGTSGKVTSAAVSSSTLESKEVGTCITGQAKRWVFPKPAEGETRVSYPFVFEPG